MKKVFLSIFAILVFLSFPASAFADASVPPIDVKYVNPSGTRAMISVTAPSAATNLFSVTKDPANPDVAADISFGNPEAATGFTGYQVPVSLPDYTKVGKYVYYIRQNTGTEQGVTYDDKDIVYVVIAKYESNVSTAIITEAGMQENSNNEKKIDFTNTCSYGSLIVSNSVTGSTGDQNKDFTINVSFSVPESAEETVLNTITYYNQNGTELTYESFTFSENRRVASVSIPLKHNESVTFSNIPAGVTYTVTQETVAGYDTPHIQDHTGIIGAADETEAVVENNSDQSNFNTGVMISNLPYFAVLAVSVAGLVLFIVRRFRQSRKENSSQ